MPSTTLPVSDNEARVLVEQSADGIVVVDTDGRIVFANAAAAALLRQSPTDLPGYELGYATVSDAPVELVIAPASPQPTTVELRARPLTWRGRPAQVINLRDVTQRKLAEDQKRASDAQLHALFENSIDAILIAAEGGRYVDANPAACELLGYTKTQLLGMSVADLVIPPGETSAADRFRHYTKAGGQETGSFVFERPDGSVRITEYSAFKLSGNRYASILRDITDRVELAEQLRQSQKMEAIGKLAGGVAHDFNNLLTAIISFSRLVQLDLPQGDPRRDDIGQVLYAADRAASLTRQLLAFSRRQPIKPQTTDLNEIIASAGRLLMRTIGEHIELEVRRLNDLWPVFIDPGQFEQVLLNLAVNARDAMPDGGKLQIETRNESDDDGNWVVLSVSDTGTGMSDEVKARVFEPFFTTKRRGEGTGLGLSTVFGLVTQANGTIAIDSELGRGTRFDIRIPRAEQVVKQARNEPLAISAPGGDACILVVEDEPLVLRAVERILTNRGYRVLTASDGDEALEMLNDHDSNVTLVLCDMVMPKTGGLEVRRQLKQRRPELAVLMMTGYSEEARGVVAPGESQLELLMKPFSEEVLLQRVHELLSRA